MATSEYIRKNTGAGKQIVEALPSLVVPDNRISGPAFAPKLLLMLSDVLVISLTFAFVLVLKVRFLPGYGEFHSLSLLKAPVYYAFFGWFLLSLLFVCRRYGLYNLTRPFSGTHELRLVVQATLTAGLLLCGGLYLAHWNIASRTVVVLLICTSAFSLSVWRSGLRIARYRNFEKGVGTRNVVVLGNNYLSHALGQHIASNYRLGYRFLGHIAPGRLHTDEHTVVTDVLGTLDRLHQLTRLHFIDEVVIAQALPSEEVIGLLEQARELGIDVRTISGLYSDLATNSSIEYLGVYPVTSLHRTRSKFFSTVIKRIFDILFSTLALVIAAPLMVIVALAVRLDSPGPIFYISERVGKRGRVFPCFKFRTMVKDAEKKKKELVALNERDGILFKISNDPRITRVGRFLRKYSLDELPQFFNVLRGEMSIVGPRPPIASEVAQYELEHFRRLEVTPGLTGLWQVQARQDSSFAKYIELDTAYVENWSFWLDLKILMRTALVVIRGTGT
ncbi:sugar transferase [Pseudacidobacterium ailaaui]|jgi:exopolysaccharide biosynthesis polyprenyl glycosylphosphotransferase|uniref:sugar transferase n=1 Tax=Pseudacidobacterium ailaaui TaxID=1382359 RepID=UPI000678E5D1|nr:sugar transferase [Pseudacidobacterium ailaaui]MDI3255729.1 sugar transferase [Bacillota bacterium]